MDKNAIKKYAIWARRELIARVSQRAALYEITAEGYGDADAVSVHGHILSLEEKNQRRALIAQIQQKGFEQVMEEIAYTWFNRFSALRFMEVNGYLPTRIRVFTDEENHFKPQIMTEAINLEMDGLDMQKVFAFKDANDDDGLFKYLIITQCNALSSILPGMFQKIADFTELLFPDNLLREGSVVEQMVSMIPEEDWTDQVQIIGWLYQYYNTEPKDKVFSNLKKNIKISKENIPAATQLFTPDWIVRYMVENSLGRLWIEGHPNDELKAKWKYYLDEAEQEEEVKKQLAEIRKEYAALKPEDIRCIDPCMGSGHILVYMFDVLIQIYESYGYSAREAVSSIVEHNIWGLDIDERAAQLAYFSVMMKARQYDSRFLVRNVQPHVYVIYETNTLEPTFRQTIYKLNLPKKHKETLIYLFEMFANAKEYGSILQIESRNYLELRDYCKKVERQEEKAMSLWDSALSKEVSIIIEQAIFLSQKYHVVITNPPYMGLRNMSKNLFDYVMSNYKDAKQDLFGAFMKVCIDRLCSKSGKVAMITQHVWMFTSGFEKYRKNLYAHQTISSMIHLGTRAFEEISGEVVQTCTFVINKILINNYKGNFVRLVHYNNASDKEIQFFNHNNYYVNSSNNFLNIPGSPVCYWLNKQIIEIFKNNPLVGDISTTRQGLKTSDDKRFIRLFFEVSDTKIAKGILSLDEAAKSSKKWFWLNKGGQVKWYGNNIYLINWENNGKEVKDYAAKIAGSYSKNITAIDAYFQHCISWPQISISHPSFRYIPDGYIFASAGPSLFVKDEEQRWYMLGLLNSIVTQNILDAINPTINFGVSDILKIPYIYNKSKQEEINSLVKRAINLATESWNSYELSWDFKQSPLITGDVLIKDSFKKWCLICDQRFNELKCIELRLNELFYQIYGLTDELDVLEVEENINITRADVQSDIKNLISYAVGCMFGRYSLDQPGFILSGQAFKEKFTYATVAVPGTSLSTTAILSNNTITKNCYLKKEDGNLIKCTFDPDEDAIIPICEDEYFNDDIVGRFVKFIEVVYGKETLEENLKFIADALGGNGTAREIIRNYFINVFYSDHVKIFQKRPIYWLFDSGKKNGFKCLVYMHRYQPDTIARIRTDYVHEQQSRYRTAMADLQHRIDNATTTSERVKLSKKLKTVREQDEELRIYEEKIHHLADQMIKIDLDDGVKHNYEKFASVLAKIK